MSYHKKTAAVLVFILCLLLGACGGTMPAEDGAPVKIAAENNAQPGIPSEDITIPEGAVAVSDVDALLAAIGSDREIYLKPGVYDLTQAQSYGGSTDSPYCYWEEIYDGYELVIAGVSNLKLTADHPSLVSVVTEPRYANVLRFDNCSDIALNRLTAGHTQEPGTCSGGVLMFNDSKAVQVEGCSLYGCGIRGVDAYCSADLTIRGTEIYDCSYGAALISGCRNVLFDDCSIHDVLFYSLFEVYNTDGFALVNSTLSGNTGDDYGAMFNLMSSAAYMGGLDVGNSSCQTVFSSYASSLAVEGCSFDISYEVYTAGTEPVDLEGSDLTEEAFLTMELQPAAFDPSAIPVRRPTAEMEAEEDGWVHVSTVDDFLAAIAPGISIYLEPGIYDLSTASDYGMAGSGYYGWTEAYDGYELVIMGADGLRISGGKKNLVTIAAQSTYANVLAFENCKGVKLTGFTAGHLAEPGSCAGGVLMFRCSDQILIRGCGLYGCGTVGVWGVTCDDLTIDKTEIYECSEEACYLFDCNYVTLSNCWIHDIPEPIFTVTFCSEVYVDGEPIPEEYVSSAG